MNNKVLHNEKNLKREFTRFILAYKFALNKIETKVNILKEEFQFFHDYNPIEHVNTRLKSLDSIYHKVVKKGVAHTIESIQEHIKDIAGIRITCSFVSDIYRLSDLIQAQEDIHVIEVKDYIKQPKRTGYRSLHLIIKVPVFLSDRVEEVFVEMQIRTVAMDFWASLEHKIYYKYDREIPSHLSEELVEASRTASELEQKMERLNKEINQLKKQFNDDLKLPE